MKKVSILLFTFFLIACNHGNIKQDDIYSAIVKIMSENECPSSLVLFVSENMCSECINKELINIQENNNSINRITIIGAYSNKRFFNAYTNKLKPIESLHIDIANLSDMTGTLFYCKYNSSTKTISDFFYPDPCDVERTKEYYKSVANS